MKTIITTAVAMTLLASSAMAYGEKHGYQPPVGGPGYGEGASQENDIHGDSYSPDHMDGGGDSIDGYEDEMNHQFYFIGGEYAQLLSCEWGSYGYKYGYIGTYKTSRGAIYTVFFGNNYCQY